MPLIKVPTVTLYTGTKSFVYVDPTTINNVRPESFEVDGNTIDTICFTAGRTTWNTTWSLKTFFIAMGRDHSDSVYDTTKPLAVSAS
jgi:hypothetical protein